MITLHNKSQISNSRATGSLPDGRLPALTAVGPRVANRPVVTAPPALRKHDPTHRPSRQSRTAPLVSALVSERSRVNGQVIVAGRGWARRTATVEADTLVYVGPEAAVDASAQLQAEPWRIAGICREFRDGREAYEDCFSHFVGGLRQP